MRSDVDSSGDAGSSADTDSSGDTDSSTDADSSSLPDCPRCGEPVALVTATGPHTGTANPCGCSVPPGLLERES